MKSTTGHCSIERGGRPATVAMLPGEHCAQPVILPSAYLAIFVPRGAASGVGTARRTTRDHQLRRRAHYPFVLPRRRRVFLAQRDGDVSCSRGGRVGEIHTRGDAIYDDGRMLV